MAKELVINAGKDQTQIAIIEGGDLAELYIESQENIRTIGDIYLGRVRKIMPSIRAAFVDIGQKQDAFLHFSDLADNLDQQLAFVEEDQPDVTKVMAGGAAPKRRSQRRRPRGRGNKKGDQGQDGEGGKQKHRRSSDAHERGQRRSAQRRSKKKSGGGGRQRGRQRDENQPRPETLLKRDRRILVKIVKEPISNKGSRVSTDISLAGRFLVLVPMADYVAVSKKIRSYKERRRLRALARSLLPEGFGVIVRTVAEGRNAKALDTDLRLLQEKWNKLEKKLAGKPNPPLLVHQDVNMVSSVIRDLFSEDFDRVLVDDQRLFRNVKSYIQAVAPQMAPSVELYKGKQHIFEEAKIAREVAQAFESRVELPSGGYLFIERTEAMHVVDVNSGRSGRGMTQEENSLRVNLESARVIARQVRLRDLGGIIVVDFIDLRDERNKKKVYDELKKEFKKDRAVSKILPMSDFGLVQITRQRLRPSITTTFSGPNGVGADAVEDDDEPAAKQEQPAPREDKPAERRQKPAERRQKPAERRDKAARREERPDEEPRHESSSRGRSQRRARPPKHPGQTPAELIEEMEQWIVDYKVQGNRRGLVLKVHPFTAAYLNRKVPNYPTRWFMKHLIRVRLDVDEALAPITFCFLDARDGKDLTDDIRKAAEQMKQA